MQPEVKDPVDIVTLRSPVHKVLPVNGVLACPCRLGTHLLSVLSLQFRRWDSELDRPGLRLDVLSLYLSFRSRHRENEL